MTSPSDLGQAGLSKREGPDVYIEARCTGCIYERSVSYRVQGDSGHDVSCAHPSEPGRSIGDTTWRTPDWCPLLPVAIEKLARRAAAEAIGGGK